MVRLFSIEEGTRNSMKIDFCKKIVGLLVVLALSAINSDTSDAAGQWFQKADGATVRGDHAAVAYNGKMYIFGGADNNSPGLLNDLWEYNIASDNWTLSQGTTPLAPRDCHTTVVFNGKMYIFGGFHYGEPHRLNDVWECDIINKSWRQRTSGASGRNNDSAVVYNGKIYIFGGKDNNYITVNDLWEYDITTDSWAQKNSAPVARRAHTAVIHNAKMYIFGGSDNSDTISNDLWAYDFSSDSWAQKNSAPFSRADHSAIVYDDKMYIFAGAYIDGEENIVFCNDLWAYDFANGSWAQETTIGSQPSERIIHSAVVYNDKMYVFGGGTFDENETWNYFNNLWEYNFAADVCEGDFNGDRDVDGLDLSVFAVGNIDISLDEFARHFGRTDCLD